MLSGYRLGFVFPCIFFPLPRLVPFMYISGHHGWLRKKFYIRTCMHGVTGSTYSLLYMAIV